MLINEVLKLDNSISVNRDSSVTKFVTRYLFEKLENLFNPLLCEFYFSHYERLVRVEKDL